MSKGRKFLLEHPVTLDDGSAVRALLVRKPEQSDLDGYARNAEELKGTVDEHQRLFDLRMELYGKLCGVDREIIDEMDVRDLERLDALLDELTGHGG